jgi:uncharacterized protein YraI
MTRRAALRAFGGAGAAVFAVALGGRSVLAQISAEQHTSTPYTVTANLNLRAEPSTSAKVLLVIPKGGIITLNAKESNGFYSVNYKGTNGWAHSSYIVPADSSAPDPTIIGSARTVANVNLRTGPGTSYAVIRVVPQSTQVGITATVRNGFRYVDDRGTRGWIADSYLGHVSDGDRETFTTTTNLNLRAEPSTSAKVLLVMPANSVVETASGTAPGWRQVIYKGTKGWAATDYLN